VDTNGIGVISVSEVRSAFKMANIDMKSIQQKFDQLLNARGESMLNILEVFEKFGTLIEEYADRNLTLEEVVSFLTTFNSISNTNNALIFLAEILQRMQQHPTDPKFRKLNFENEKLGNLVLNLQGGDKLLHILGFSEPSFDVLSQKTFVYWGNPGAAHSSLSSRDLDKIRHLLKEINEQQERNLGGVAIRDLVATMRKQYSAKQLILALETLHQMILNMLQNPNDYSKFRVKIENKIFQKRLGYIVGSEKLMNAIGFQNHQDNLYLFNSANLDGNSGNSPLLDNENRRFLLRRKVELENGIELLETGMPIRSS
jgi:hypothetical protein